ncbi:MAG TPA: hypothetical protein VII75_02710 [Thermoanaerobaculia bacterium]|nr:hypothetical protein [Thermoanaerobaculia bacterium]
MSSRSFRVVAVVLSLFAATLTSAQQHNLAVSKAGPASANAGEVIIYTITVSNPSTTGSVDAPNVSMTDTLPAGVTFTQLQQTSGPGFSCTTPAVGSGGTITCTNANFTVGSTSTFDIHAQLPGATPGGTEFDNTANVTAGGIDSDPADNSSTSTLTIAATTDFGVSKNGPATANSDTDVSFDITVVNGGPDTADVTLTDTLPVPTTFVSFTQNSGPAFSCSDPGVGNNGQIVCTNASMAPGSATFTIVLHVPPATAPGTEFTNKASVTTTGGFDPNGENNQSFAGFIVQPIAADVGVTKSGPAAASPGANVSYTITVFNAGPSDATNVTLTDTLPGTMTFVSLSQSGPPFGCTTPAIGAGGTISCSAATFTAGGATTFTLTGNIPGATPSGTAFANTATVTSDADPNPDNNKSTVELITTTVDPAIVKNGPGTATAGQQIAYTIGLANNGTDTATNVHWIDQLPAGTTFAGLVHNSGSTFNCVTPSAGNPGTVDCFLLGFPGGGSANYTLTLNIATTFPDGGTLTNTAFITSDEDIDPSNDTSSTSATVTGVTDLSVTKTGPANATTGSNISWTITVNNNGANTAANTQLTDTLPAGATFVSLMQNNGPAFNCSGTSSITCTNAAFAAGASATFTLTATISSSAPAGTLSNTANVTTTTAVFNSGNDSSTANTTIATSADVAVTKSGPATAVQNQDVSYTIGVTNNGPSDAQNVTLSDTIPPQATFVSMNQNTGPAFNCSGTSTVSCTIATLAAGASATFTLTVHTTASVTGGMLNTATVSSSTSDPNSANNSASAPTNLVTADVAVTKSGSPATVAAGSNITWTITVTNNGPGDATNVTMNDALPPNTTFVSLTQNTGPSFNCSGTTTVTCTIATLTNGASATFTLVAQTAQAAPPGTLSNTATVSSTSPLDPTPANNTSTSNTTVALVDLTLTKTISNGPYVAGTPVTFTLTVTNNGTVAANNVVVTDVLPAGMFASSTTPPGACTGTTTVTCTAATLAAGASTAFTITATLPATQGNYSNTAMVTSANGDSAPANNTSTAQFAVVPGNAIPTLDPTALLLFALLLGAAAVIAFKR